MVIQERDKPVLAALAARYQLGWQQRDEDRRLKEEIEKRLQEVEAQMTGMLAAIQAFGVEIVAGWFRPLRDAVGGELFDQAFLEAGVTHNWMYNDPAPLQLGAPAVDQVDFDLEGAETASSGSTVRELTLERLRSAGDRGTKAASIRTEIERARGTTLHEKTVGMTLYRLARDGLARREGRIWFYVAPSATKNPGGDTPGPINRDD